MADENTFERLRDMAAGQIGRYQEATNRAFGVGQRPFGTKKLTKPEKSAYYASLDPARRQELWSQMDEAERNELTGG